MGSGIRVDGLNDQGLGVDGLKNLRIDGLNDQGLGVDGLRNLGSIG